MTSVFGDGGRSAAKGSRRAADAQVGFQREALDYLKESEALPKEIREGALTSLAGIYGLPGGEGSQQGLIDQAMASPLYQSIIGGRKAGEESILRHAGATGGLRSGNTKEALYDYNTQLENQALLESYNQQLSGLSGLSGLPSRASEIASYTSGIGETMGAGILGAAQTRQAGRQQRTDNLMGLAKLGMMAFSDIRLKDNIEYVGHFGPHKIYKWDWNEDAEKLGLIGPGHGVMAHKVYEYMPEAIAENDGYIVVDYQQIMEAA